MFYSFRTNLILLLCSCALWLTGQSAIAQAPPSVPEGVGIEEHLGEMVPLDISFRDDHGKEIFLGSLFNQGKPVVLSLNYSDCPMLCSLQLGGLVDALKEIDGWTAGSEFQVVSVSIDPEETTQKARDTKAKYVNAYGKQNSVGGWSFLTGSQRNIDKLTRAVGFQYKYIPETREYAHTAVLIICAPDGKITRYLYGVDYPSQTVKLSLLEAAEGKVGSTTEKFLLFCYRYDPTTGKYSLLATRVMTFGAILTLTFVGLLVVPVWIRSMRSKTIARPKSPPGDSLDQSVSVSH